MHLNARLSLFLAAILAILVSTIGHAQDRRVPNGHYYGSLLICDDGYKDVGGKCNQLPSVTKGHYYGSLLICDDGYKDVGGQCRQLAAVANAHYYGSIVICNDGYVFSKGGYIRSSGASSIRSRIDPAAIARSSRAPADGVQPGLQSHM